MNPFQPTTASDEDDFHDPIEVFASQDLAGDVVEMFRQFGGENAATALLSRIFWFDADCHLVWETQFETQHPSPQQASRDSAMIFGLLNLVAGPMSQTSDEELFSPTNTLVRWQRATRDLLRIDEAVRPDAPWLYGWAQFGVDVCQEARPRRIALRDGRLCKAVNPTQPAFDAFADELPYSLEELLALPGIGQQTARRAEQRLIKTLLDPSRYAPTKDEMMSPDFDPCLPRE